MKSDYDIFRNHLYIRYQNRILWLREQILEKTRNLRIMWTVFCVSGRYIRLLRYHKKGVVVELTYTGVCSSEHYGELLMFFDTNIFNAIKTTEVFNTFYTPLSDNSMKRIAAIIFANYVHIKHREPNATNVKIKVKCCSHVDFLAKYFTQVL